MKHKKPGRETERPKSSTARGAADDVEPPVTGVWTIWNAVKKKAGRWSQPADSDDNASDVALTVIVQRETNPLYAGNPSKLNAFAFSSAGRDLATRLRDARRREEKAPAVAQKMLMQASSSTGNPELDFFRRELEAVINAGLATMSKDLQIAWVMRRLERRGLPDIAAALGCSVPNASTKAYRAGLLMEAYVEAHWDVPQREMQS